MQFLKQGIKRFVASVNPALTKSGYRVLLYHAVDDPTPSDWLSLRIAPKEFHAQMDWLRREGYRVVPLSSLLEEQDHDAARTVAITFDDGFRSQLAAADILAEFGFPATFFVASRFLNGAVGGTEYWERWEHFGWNDLQGLSNRGFEIGAHSASHIPLTRCPPRVLQEEVEGVKLRLQDRLRCEVLSFSYPHGAFNCTVERAVVTAGYRLACTSIYGANRAPWSWFALRRIEITGRDRLRDFRLKLLGKYDWLAAWQRRQASHA